MYIKFLLILYYTILGTTIQFAVFANVLISLDAMQSVYIYTKGVNRKEIIAI